MGYGRPSSSGGARGEGGSGGAFTGNRGLGLTTGNVWHGTSAFGPAGGMAQGYASRDQRTGMYGDFRGLDGQRMSGYTTQNGYPAMSSKMADLKGYPGGYVQPVIARPLPPPPNIVPTAAPPPVGTVPPAQPAPYTPTRFGPWPGQSAIPPNGPVYSQQRVTQVPKSNFGGVGTYTANDIRRDPGRWK